MRSSLCWVISCAPGILAAHMMFKPRSHGLCGPLLGQPFYGWYCAPHAGGSFRRLAASGGRRELGSSALPCCHDKARSAATILAQGEAKPWVGKAHRPALKGRRSSQRHAGQPRSGRRTTSTGHTTSKFSFSSFHGTYPTRPPSNPGSPPYSEIGDRRPPMWRKLSVCRVETRLDSCPRTGRDVPQGPALLHAYVGA